MYFRDRTNRGADRTLDRVKGRTPDPQGRALWSLSNASGDELRCETHETAAGVCLRFCTTAGVLRTSGLIQAPNLESWIRIWRAYYLTSGWSVSSVAGGDAGRLNRGTACKPSRRGSRAPDSTTRPESGWLQVVTGPILRYWSVRAADGATVACELVRTQAGLEVRCDTFPMRAQLVSSMAEGLALSHAWKSEHQLGAAQHDRAETPEAAVGGHP